MATVAEIRNGIKTRLDTIDGIQSYAVLPGDINAPAAVVSRRSTQFDSTFGGASDDLTFAVTVFVHWVGVERDAQEKLDTYLAPTGATSVKAAIEGDPTLGNKVDYARVSSVEQENIREWGGIRYLAADLIVEVG
jgi:hypothetical protein